DPHRSHHASAFLPSPFQQAAVMCMDGRGEKATTSYYAGNGNNLDCIRTVDMPHSLGLLYEAVTTHLGFLHSSEEYKVMALASYGKPVYVRTFREIIQLTDNGGYVIDRPRLEERFGPARLRHE